MDVSADAGGEDEVFIEVSPRYIDADKEGTGSKARDSAWVWCMVANPWIRETISCQSVILPGPGLLRYGISVTSGWRGYQGSGG